MKKLLLLAVLIAGFGCSANYQFGDITKGVLGVIKGYCASVNPTFRAEIRANLKERGFDIGVDTCATYGLVDELKVLLSGE